MKSIKKGDIKKLLEKLVFNFIVIIFVCNIVDQFINSADLFRWLLVAVVVVLATLLDFGE
ncbi:hypothetical protein [Lactococcus muris]|uniref:hypothetical protein n=1 Tax=Lactococcus muris TaxID=2941330 RepID=UPI0023004A41